MQPLNYQNTGVNYDVLDQFKRNCQKAAGQVFRPRLDRRTAIFVESK